VELHKLNSSAGSSGSNEAFVFIKPHANTAATKKMVNFGVRA
jgi:hypothetical protein